MSDFRLLPKSQSTRIGIDTSALDPKFKEHSQRGIGRYVSKLTQHLGEGDSEIAIGKFDHTSLGNLGVMDKVADLLPAGKMTFKQQLLYPLRISRRLRDFDVLHFPAHMDAPTWAGKPIIVTVLDLIPLVLKDLYKADRPSWRFHLARTLEIRAIKNASLILAISECTAKDTERLLGIPRDRIIVTPLGVDSRFFEINKLRKIGKRAAREDLVAHAVPADKPMVLYVGGIDQRKNIDFLVTAFSELSKRRRARGETEPVLVMCGRIAQDREYPKFKAAVARENLLGSVVEAGYVPDELLMKFYAGADVFFFPSLYEGFGLPALEAMAAGLPVVSSNTSSLPEIVSDAGILIDPTRLTSAAEALDAVLASDELNQRLSDVAPKRAMLFSWDKTAQLTREAYQQARRFVTGRN